MLMIMSRKIFPWGIFLKGVYTRGSFHNEGFSKRKRSDKKFSGGEWRRISLLLVKPVLCH